MKKYVMALDQGTTSSRCILFDKAGHMKSVVQREFTQIYPKPGWVEPVSYTHLDVYKRQVLCHGSAGYMAVPGKYL